MQIITDFEDVIEIDVMTFCLFSAISIPFYII